MFLPLALLSVAMTLGAPQDSQTILARHAVRGVVEDPSGLPVLGAQVVLRKSGDSAPQQQKTATSGEDGSFRFESVPKGKYLVEAFFEGFAPFQKKIVVKREDSSLRIRLKIARVDERSTVVAAGAARLSTEPAENWDSIELDREMLDALPVMDQDVLSTAMEFLDDGALGGGVSIVVDGMEGDAIGVTPSAIQEIRVNRNPYSAEYSRPGRGRVEVITKRGSEEYHGQFNFLLRDYRMDARNAFASEKPRQQRRRYEGHLAGPLSRSGKSTFLISAERDEADGESVVFAQTLDGLVQGNVPNPERENEFSARFNHYAGDKHVFSARYWTDRETETGSGVGGFSLPEVAFSRNDESHRVRLSHRWFVSPAWFTELSVRIRVDRERNESVQENTRRMVVLDSFTSGGAQRSEITNRDEFGISYTASWSGGKHTLRTGVQVPDMTRYETDDRDNFGGTYYFASLADFEAQTPFSFTQQQGESRLSFRTRNVSLFAQDDIRLRPGLTLGLGLRYDRQNFLSDANNLAPRASVAWKIGREGATVVRTGVGVFYDRARSSAIRDTLRFDGETLRRIVISDPTFPDPNSGGSSGSVVPPGIVRFESNPRSPYSTQVSFGVERELQRSLMLSVSYVRRRGAKMFRSLDRNAPLAPDYLRPDPTLGIVREIESSGTLKSHSMNIQLRARMGRRFQGRVLYTLGSAYDDTEWRDTLPPDSNDLSDQWARANYDRRHRFRIYSSLSLPASMNLGFILRAQTGAPYNWTTGEDTNRDGSARERPEGVPRNALEGPGAFTGDFRLSRKFSMGQKNGGPALRVALDAFNILNRVNFSRFIGNQSSPFFGQAVGARSARRLQLSLRLSF